MTLSVRASFGAAAAAALAALLFAVPHTAHAAQIIVTITDNQFTPANLTINAGDTVVWRNQGQMSHTATANNGSFDSGTIPAGGVFSATFPTTGTYAYHCNFHQGMVATTTVVAAGAAVNTSTNYSNVPPSTADQLRAQAQELLNRLTMLQAGLGGQTTGAPAPGGGGVKFDSSSCPLIGRSLKRGSSGDDVLRLQQFLARDPSIYPEAQATGYYGALTEAAVKRWQVKYNIVSSGSPESTGYGVVGPRTAAAIALLCTTGSYGGVPGPSNAPVGGFIQVTPVSGAAPLSVKVDATVNTTNSCSGATYTLDWGDGTVPSQINVPAGNCAQMTQTLNHVYTQGGTFQVTLASGSHRTSASVVVSGPGGAQNPGAGTGGAPRGSISAFVTSGSAPLNVTFYVSCVGAAAYNVVFGDGQELGGSGVAKTACQGGLDSVQHSYTTAGNYSAQLIIFVQQSNGTIAPQAAGSVAIGVSGGTPSSGGGGGGGGGGGVMTVTPGVNGDPMTVGVQYGGSCTTYRLDWGDGSTAITGSCPAGSIAQQHTYGLTGSYTISLTHDSQTDTASVVIQ